jgi:ABC-type thiamin/hydroxymethylpyrimidine transport system permease subunit
MPQRYGDHQKNPASLIETMVNIMTNTTKALIIDLISLLLSALTLSFNLHPLKIITLASINEMQKRFLIRYVLLAIRTSGHMPEW